jgi:LEA14-like dessication related protein
MQKGRHLTFLLFLLLLFSCKTPAPPAPPPPPEKDPLSFLGFEKIEAERIDRISLFFLLSIENPRASSLTAEIGDWRLFLNDVELERRLGEAVLSGGETIEAAPGARVEIPLRLDLDLSRYAPPPVSFPGSAAGTVAASAAADEYTALLRIDLNYRFAAGKGAAETLAVEAVFPRIREPEFTITSIAILQAELINTRFRVSLRIDNPNVFPVDLSSFGYELYGEGRFWAEGAEQDVLHIPAHGSEETKLFLVMNFINMKRSLLDEIIAMRQVRYRFTGEVLVGTGVPYLPQFHMDFDKSGNSAVYK